MPPDITVADPILAVCNAAYPTSSSRWKGFGDPQLDRIMTDAMGDNPTLAAAMARLVAATPLGLGLCGCSSSYTVAAKAQAALSQGRFTDARNAISMAVARRDNDAAYWLLSSDC